MAKRKTPVAKTVKVSLSGLIQASAAYEALRAEVETLKKAALTAAILLKEKDTAIALLKKGSETAVQPKAVEAIRFVKSPSLSPSARKSKTARKESKKHKKARTARVSILMTIPSGERVAIAKRSFATVENLANFLRKQGRRWTNKVAKSSGLQAGMSVTLRVMPSALPETFTEQSITLQ